MANDSSQPESEKSDWGNIVEPSEADINKVVSEVVIPPTGEGGPYVDESVTSPEENDFDAFAERQKFLDTVKAEAEASLIPDQFRSPLKDGMGGGKVLDNQTDILIEQMFERLLQNSENSAEAIAVARLTHLHNIAQLSTGFNKLTTAILYIAEALGITHTTTTIVDFKVNSVEVPVKVANNYSVLDLQQIAIRIHEKATTAVEYKNKAEDALYNMRTSLESSRLALAEKTQEVNKLLNAPKPALISNLPYVLKGTCKETGNTLYVTYNHRGNWDTTTSFSAANRWSTSDNACKILITLLSNDDHEVINPKSFNICKISIEVDSPQSEHLRKKLNKLMS